MKENNLYKHIVYTLFNLFSQDKLKGWIILEKEFKELIIKQIANLLTLEKSFDCQLKEVKYAKVYAQVLANVTGESALIEKIDNPEFSKLDEEYVEFLKYISEHFKATKEQLTIMSQELNVDIVDATSDFINKDALLIKLKEEKLASDLDKQEPTDQSPPIVIPPITNTTNGLGGMGSNSFNNSNMFAGMAGMMAGGNMMNHPKMDERFYPYDRKPKNIYLFKQIFAWISIALICLIVVFIFLTNFGIVNTHLNAIFYTNDKNQIFIWGNPDNDHNTAAGYKSGELKLNLGSFFRFNFLVGILIIFIAGYLAYNILAPKRYKQEKYIISRFNLGLALIVYIILFGFVISSVFPTFVKDVLNSSSILTKSSVSDNQEPASDIKDFINIINSNILNNAVYKIGFGLSIVLLVVSFSAIILGIIIFIIAPRLDRNKLILAETEYQKMVAAAMRGQKYEPNSSLFDEEFRHDKNDDNPSKQNNKS